MNNSYGQINYRLHADDVRGITENVEPGLTTIIDNYIPYIVTPNPLWCLRWDNKETPRTAINTTDRPNQFQ